MNKYSTSLLTALILNSGMGSRMGALTKEHPKCMTEIAENETILSRQLKMIARKGIKNVVMTTGLFDQILVEYCQSLNLPLHYTFIKNPVYSTTNYIYSMFCARKYLNGDILLMHGDLVFDDTVLADVLCYPQSCMAVSSTLPLPEKDFKAIVINGKIQKVGIDFFNNAVAAQPLYKLLAADWKVWLDNIVTFCVADNLKCYAEDALNEVLNKLILHPLDVKDAICAEIDCAEDLTAVSRCLLQQKQLTTYNELERHLIALDIQNLMVVGGSSLNTPQIQQFLSSIKGEIEITLFSGYTPNPTIDEVNDGVNLFVSSGCNAILAIGGGSAIDIAKAIKYYLLNKQQLPLLVIPTTAGTGSEATHFAVIYFQGEKKSIVHHSLVPDIVLFDAKMLNSLSLYQRKCTMLDAVCHAIESFWSVKATEKSKVLSKQAIQLIMANYRQYLKYEIESNLKMLKAANIAGQAINLTQTTAGHAMCYKLTSLYGIPHGYAAALCCRVLWKWMLDSNLIAETLNELQNTISYDQFSCMIDDLDMPLLKVKATSEYEVLTNSVNIERLQNHPVSLDSAIITKLYKQIL